MRLEAVSKVIDAANNNGVDDREEEQEDGVKENNHMIRGYLYIENTESSF